MKVLQGLNSNLQYWKYHHLGILVSDTQNEINVLKPYVFRNEDGNTSS